MYMTLVGRERLTRHHGGVVAAATAEVRNRGVAARAVSRPALHYRGVAFLVLRRREEAAIRKLWANNR